MHNVLGSKLSSRGQKEKDGCCISSFMCVCVGGRGFCVAFVVARCAHLQSAAAARGIDRCCKRRRALPNRAKRCFVAVAVAWPNCGPNMCVCVLRHSLSVWPAACCKQRACGMCHLWHTYKSNWYLVRGTRNRLRCVSFGCRCHCYCH